ncbi:hypothetical protein A2U01_0061923, partial [Trifolium medium]|nr:hypothetical protein [Trifolium medium]
EGRKNLCHHKQNTAARGRRTISLSPQIWPPPPNPPQHHLRTTSASSGPPPSAFSSADLSLSHAISSLSHGGSFFLSLIGCCFEAIIAMMIRLCY